MPKQTKKPEVKKKLTDKQKRFCEEYLVDLNATQAAIRAGYSEKTAYSIGDENLRKPEIQTYISGLQNITSNKLEVTRERVLNEYAKIAFFDIRKVYNENGGLKAIHELDDDTAAALASLESYEEKDSDGVVLGMNRKVKAYDKKAALDSICKMLGYNAPDKIDSSITVNWQEEKTYDK
jgi:phage terminase small subunit